jgi:mannose-1-phosphate guanylyltransferase/phosphomannomutase
VEIGPYTVIQDYNEIGEQTSIRRSVLWNYNTLEKKVEIRGASICSKVEIKNNASIYEGAVIGDECQLNSHSIIKPDVKIWPGKSIDQGVIVQDNLIWGTKLTKTLFGKNGISGVVNVDINPQFMVRLGSAFGAELKPGKRIAVSSDQHNASVMLKTALSSGLLSSGTEVFDLGRLTTPILRYAVKYFGLDGGVHIYCKADNCNKTRAHFIDKQGSNLSPDFERKIENSFIRDDYQRQSADKLQRLNSINDIPMFYMRHLLNSIDADAIKKRK